MKKRTLYIAIASLALGSCSPRVLTSISVQRDPLPEDAEVALLNENEPAPTDGEKLGTVKVGDSGFTTYRNATYEIVTDIAKDRAREAGGNLVKVTEHKAPDFASSIHRINADIYSVSDISTYLPSRVMDTTLALNTYSAVHSESKTVTRQESLDQIASKAGYRISLYAGYGYRLGKVPGGLDNVLTIYLKELKNGVNFGGDFTYFFPSQPTGFSQGIGAKLNVFKAKNSLYGTFQYDDGTTAEGSVRDNISIIYSGVMYAIRVISEDSRHIFWMNYGLGLSNYIDKGVTPKQDLTISGSVLGYDIDLGYDLQIVKNLYLGVAASLYTGSLAAITYKDNETGKRETVTLNSKQRENIGQLSITGGLKFHF